MTLSTGPNGQPVVPPLDFTGGIHLRLGVHLARPAA